ncbi:hypothetical protein G7Y89_g6813 [Cudoniella acicularis]|uniref:Cytochrome P450 n=1 Tax=Cudoniella acicularis TaxID=354080 RepID=A0A8H4RMA4_9HELO|nr:hypothetical protein G7Y89_g6813 [Cudoniella acicularis]
MSIATTAHYAMIWLLEFDGRLHSSTLPDHIDSVLDIGCGTGQWALAMADSRPNTRIVAIDLALPNIIPPPNLELVSSNADQPWLFDDLFDFIHARTISSGIHDWPGLLARCKDHLKPGGRLEILDVNLPFGAAAANVDNSLSPFIQWGNAAEESWAQKGLDFRATESTYKGFANWGLSMFRKRSHSGHWEWADTKKGRKIGALTLQSFLVLMDLAGTFLFFNNPNFSEDHPQGLMSSTREDLVESCWDTLFYYLHATPLIKQFPFLLNWAQRMPHGIVSYFSPALARILQLHQDMHERAAKYLESQHRPKEDTSGNPRPELFHIIYTSSLPLAERSLQRMAQEGFTAILAGSETTARILTSATYYVLANPHVLIRLKIELDNAIQDRSKIPSFQILRKLPWLTAVIKEALRISALLTSRLPLLAPNILQFAEWTIPEKTPTSMTIRDVLLNLSAFTDPETFDPGRWLMGEERHQLDLERYFVPFSRENRICPGIE